MEILKKLRVSRRFALQGAVSGIGVSLWLPILDAMCNDHGTAFAAGEQLPTSFGIFFWGNGITPADWTPSGSGDNWQLPRNLEAFADLKNDMTFITGLDMLDAKFKGHGWGAVYVLAGGDGTLCSVTSDIDRTREHEYETANATQYVPTIDQIIADAIHTNEPFKSIETGVLPYRGINMGTVSANLAHRGPHNFLPPERDPDRHLEHASPKRARRGARGRQSLEDDRRERGLQADRSTPGEHPRARAPHSGGSGRRRGTQHGW
jgi:hypothetical protein